MAGEFKMNNNDMEFIASYLLEFFKDDPKKAIYWLLTPNPNFGGVSPAWLITMDRHAKVIKFIETAKFENSSPEQK